jgi:hypothetical protein
MQSFWIAGNGDWNTAAKWNPNGVPAASADAFISAAGNYTVSITAPIAINSITIGDAQAVLQINDPGATQAVAADLSNSGSLVIDNFGSGGSSLSIGGTLSNSNFIQIGNGGLSAGDTATAAALANSGTINIAGSSTARAVLDLTGGAPTTWTGTANLSGEASLEFGSGAITQIGDGASQGGDLFIDGPNAFAEVGATSSNSALSTLATIASNGLLDLRDGAGVTTTSGLTVNGGSARLKVDAYGGRGGSTVTIGGDLANSSFGSFGDGGVSVGHGGMSAADLLTVNGTFNNTGGRLTLTGGNQAGATAQMNVTGAAPSTLTGDYFIVGDTGGAVLQWGSGGVTQIGDGGSHGGDLYIDGANAFAEVGATNSNSALSTLATIAGNGVLDLRDGASVTTTAGLMVNGGSARLKVDAYGGRGGSAVTIGGNLANSSFGAFGDGGVSVGHGGMSVADLLTVNGTFNNTGGRLTLTGGNQAGATAQMNVTGAAPSTLTGDYFIVGDTGGAVLQWGSGGITQIGDGASNGASVYIDGANAFAEVGATDSNSALSSLATIAGNGALDLRDGTSVTTTTGLTVNGGSARLKVDAYGGRGGSTVTIGGDLANSSFGDGGVSVGHGGMSVADLLTVNGTFTNTGGRLTLTGGNQGGATAQMNVTGAAPSTLTGDYFIVGDTGGAFLRWGSGGITQIGDGASNGADLYIDGANAFAEVGATNSNSALTTLATIAGNGVLDLRDGAGVTTTTGLTVNGGAARLKIDAYGGHGGTSVSIGGNLVNNSFGSFGDGGVSVGNTGLSAADLLTVNGTLANTGGLVTLTGGNQAAGTAQMVVTGAVAATLTGNYSVVGDTGGAFLQWGSGGVTQIGDGASNGADLYIDGANAFAEIGATGNDSAIAGLTTIASNGTLDLRDGTPASIPDLATDAGLLNLEGGETISTTVALTVTGRLKIDAYGGRGGSSVTIGGNLVNSSFGSFGDGGVSVGDGGTSMADLLTVEGTLTNTGGLVNLTGGNQAGATAQMVVTGAAPSTLTGNYYIVGDTGGAFLQWGSGGITQIGDGASNGADLYIDGTNAFAEIGATSSNSALTGLATIASNGLLDLRDGAGVTTTSGLTVNGGSARLKIDAYGGHGGTSVTIGGDLVNSSFGSFGDGGVSVGDGGASMADLLTVNGTFTGTGGRLTLTGGNQAGATAQMVLTGAAPSTLTGDYFIVGNTGGAFLQWGSGGITQIGDGAGNGADLYIDGANAFAEIGATSSNSALTGLATIASNGLLDLRDGAGVTTTSGLTVNGGSARLKIDAYGGHGGASVTIGGNLVNSSFGSFGDGGVSVGDGGTSMADLLTVNGTFTDTGGRLTLTGGNQAGATAQMVVTGAAPSTLTGDYFIVGNTGGAFVQWGSGGIAQIGDGAGNGADLYIDGANAFAEIGATSSNSALDGLTTIASNGLVDLRDGASVTTATGLTVNGGSSARLKVDTYGGRGGSSVTIGGDLANASFGSFGDGGVSVGNGGMSVADLLTVNGNFTNTGLVNLTGRSPTAMAQMTVVGAATNTGTIDINAFAALDVQGSLSGAGSLSIAGGTFELGGASSSTITFNGAGGTFRIDQPASFSGTIAGLTLGDTIALVNTQAIGAAINGQTLTISLAGGGALTYQLTGNFAGETPVTMQVTSQSGTISDITLELGTNIPPTTTVPGDETVTAGVTAAISGISVADADAGNASEILTVSLSDAGGQLAASTNAGGGGGTITGSGTTFVTITGTLDQVNADLSTLTYTNSTAGTDSIDVATTDHRGGSDDHQIAVTINGNNNAPPVISVPGAQTVNFDIATTIAGVSVADADAASATETMTMTLSDASGLLAATTAAAGGGGTISGSGSTTLVISGTLDEVNADLSTLTYTGSNAGADTIDVAADDGRGGTDDRKIGVTVNPPPPPVITSPGFEVVGNNIESPIDGLSVAPGAGLPAGTQISVTLKEQTGGLAFWSANGTSGPSTTPASDVTITGTAAQVERRAIHAGLYRRGHDDRREGHRVRPVSFDRYPGRIAGDDRPD